jgi:protein-tyrosine sulfotransferase
VTFPPLFILSGPRRGSTLLRYILDTHSQIASPAEINLGALCSHLETVIRFTKGEPSYFLPLDEYAAFSIAETREIVDRIMSSYAALKGKRIWCEKSIDNLHRLALLSKIFPDARFICLHRDSLDVVHSCLECSRHGYMMELQGYAVRRPDNLVAAMMSAWIEHTDLVLDFERQNPERCFRIRYEDLVTAPEDFLRPLLAFAGVEWEDELLHAVFSSRHDQGGGDPKIRFSQRIDTGRVGSGQRINLATIPKEMRRAVDARSVQLSYPPLETGRQLPWLAASGRGTADDAAASAVRHFIEAILQERLRERVELAAAIRGSCRLVLQGQGGGKWKLDFTGEVPAIAADGGAADCSVIVSVADFEDIIAGRANPMVSLWNGKVVIEGDSALAGQVAQLIYALSQDAALTP